MVKCVWEKKKGVNTKVMGYDLRDLYHEMNKSLEPY